MKQLYRFHIERELSPGTWSATDPAFASPVELLEIPLDPPHREGQMVDLHRIAAEHGCEDFSAGPSFYLVASPPTRTEALRRALLAQGFTLPTTTPLPNLTPEPTPPAKPTSLKKWILALLIAIVIAAIIAITVGDKPSPPTPIVPKQSLAPDPTPKPPESSDQFKLGNAEFNAKRYWSARKAFTLSCNGGNEAACGFLGFLYAQGLGGPIDLKKATQLYRLSCDHEDSHSCMSLGNIYRSSNQPNEALASFRKACDIGLKEGCAQLRSTP